MIPFLIDVTMVEVVVFPPLSSAIRPSNDLLVVKVIAQCCDGC